MIVRWCKSDFSLFSYLYPPQAQAYNSPQISFYANHEKQGKILGQRATTAAVLNLNGSRGFGQALSPTIWASLTHYAIPPSHFPPPVRFFSPRIGRFIAAVRSLSLPRLARPPARAAPCFSHPHRRPAAVLLPSRSAAYPSPAYLGVLRPAQVSSRRNRTFACSFRRRRSLLSSPLVIAPTLG